ncbi:MAG: acetyltransferase [Fibrobacteres bacterium]|nr:acetyltransferase [Fibrobacterota bacterium]
MAGALSHPGIPFRGGSIRPWLPGDLDGLVALADNSKVWRNMRDAFPNPYTRSDARAWIRGVTRQFPNAHFAIEAGGPDSGPPVLAGGMGIIPQEDIHQGSAEIGYWLGEPFWGRGLMTSALEAFSDYAFETFLLRRLYARVLEWNPASMRVLEKAGYQPEGRLRRSAIKDGVVADEFLYAKIR